MKKIGILSLLACSILVAGCNNCDCNCVKNENEALNEIVTYCIEHGGTHTLIENDIGPYGKCDFPNGVVCEDQLIGTDLCNIEENPEIIDDCVIQDGEDGCAVDIDEPVVEEPTYEILEWTGYMGCIGGCEDGSDEEYVEGYYYRYTNPELGLRITTPSGDGGNYNLGFTTKRETPIFKQINDVIYSLEYDDNPNWSISDAEFIRVYGKDSNISLEDLLKQKYEDCIVKENSFDHWYSSPFVGFKGYYYMVSNSGNSYEKECGRDEGEGMGPMILFLESFDGTKYYKVGMGDACAPGPCSIFGKVEVL